MDDNNLIEALRRRGGVVVEVGGERHDVRILLSHDIDAKLVSLHDVRLLLAAAWEQGFDTAHNAVNPYMEDL